jgi:mycothiol synthase
VISTGSALSTADVDAVRALAVATERRDGAPPLSDQALVQLASKDGRVRHVLASSGRDGPRGYAQVTLDDGTVSAEVLVGLDGDRAGTADALLDAVESAASGRRILCWAHGSDSPVEAALRRHGYRPVRRLLRMERPLDDVDAEPFPDDVTVRPFEVGRDERTWLAVNARAFRDHPEQARWTEADLAAREREGWFDPAGFLLAVDVDGTLLGYHWTKLHGGDPPVGEVYVLGIDPAVQGRRLGAVLLSAGLASLYQRGARTVMLYSDDSNDTAVGLYKRRGFETVGVDTQYERPATEPRR